MTEVSRGSTMNVDLNTGASESVILSDSVTGTVTTSNTVTYCSTADVKRALQTSVTFSTSTTPTEDEVKKYIQEAEDEIDSRTNHAWREVTVSNEFYNLERNRPYSYGAGIKIFLKKRAIRAITKLEVWNGSSYEDWVAIKTEDRADNYWLDYDQGVLYLRKWYHTYLERPLRISYTYGETTVPHDIRQAATLLVAANLLMSEDRTTLLADTGDPDTVSYESRVNKMIERADNLISNRSEFITIS